MAATIEQLLVNNPNWSYAEIGVAYIAWDAAIKYMEAKFTSTERLGLNDYRKNERI